MNFSKKLVILDRDGVINYDSDSYIKSPDEWHSIPGSIEAIAKLNKIGCKVVIATNQSGIGRGYYSIDILNQIHDKMQTELTVFGGQIDKIYYCPHIAEDSCECRKPKIKMLEDIARDFGINFNTEQVAFVGDSLRDLQAADQAGCIGVLVETGKGTKTKEQIDNVLHRYKSLADFVEDLITYKANVN